MLEAIHESFHELRQWMDWAQTIPTQEGLEAVLRQGHADFDDNVGWDYTLFDVDSDEVIGCAGLHRTEQPNTFAIGYWVRTSRTGRGVATAAARTLRDAAFNHLSEVTSVIITMDVANAPSAAIPPKLEFSLLEVEDREIEALGHTGRGLVWVFDRTAIT